MEKEHVRGCNWTFDEDIVLCLTWIFVSQDGVISTNQNKKVLWGKIIDKFHENSNTGRRETGGVYDQWKIINKACILWKRSLERAMVDMLSGRGASEIGDKVMAIYKTKTTPKNQAFELHHAWNILKDCPRPPGIDKQKETKRKRKSQDRISAQIATGFARMNENHISQQEESTQMRLAMKEEGG
ncbi:hypothetical protein ACFX2J_000393 [Malus domestica]